MSTEQWAALMRGAESYAVGESHDFALVQGIWFPAVIPTSRAAPRQAFCQLMVKERATVVPTNTHFEHTRANCELSGAQALDCPPEANEPAVCIPSTFFF